MAGKHKPKRKRIRPRNPLAPVVRAKRAAVVPSKRVYTRKPKHRRSEPGDIGGDKV